MILFCSPVFAPLIYCPQLAQVYGNVFSVRLGSDKIVFVCGSKMIKEAIVTQAENFVDRPPSAVAERMYSRQAGKPIILFALYAVCVVMSSPQAVTSRFFCMLVYRWSVH